MLITVIDLEREPLEFDLAYEPGSIEYGFDIRQLDPLAVGGRADLIVEHRGPNETIDDIRVRAGYKGRFEVLCARCLDPVEHPLDGHFDLLFRPSGADGEASEHSITTSETEIGYYLRDGVLLEDVLREQVLLSLPAKTLCREDCKGLCPHCGKHLNSETCDCIETVTDPRWAALSSLRSRVKHRRELRKNEYILVVFAIRWRAICRPESVQERKSVMANPKRRHSKARTSKRRAHDGLTAVGLAECPNCHEKKQPHRACPKCGTYKGRDVLEVKEAS